MRHKTSIEIYAYWDRIRGSQAAPARSDIEPADIRTILPDLFILEKLEDSGFVFRLAGTRICALFGQELRATSFAELWNEKDYERISNTALEVVTHAMPSVLSATALIDGNRRIELEVVILPITAAGGEIDRMIGSLSILDQSVNLLDGQISELNLNGVRVLNVDGYVNIARSRPEIPVRQPDYNSVGHFFHRVMHLRVFEGGKQN